MKSDDHLIIMAKDNNNTLTHIITTQGLGLDDKFH